MPTMLPKRRPIRRDRRLEFALLGLLAVEVLTLRAAGARPSEQESGLPRGLMAPMTFTCTAAEVPCDMLAP